LGALQRIDSVRIIWPDQTTQLLKDVAVNQLLKIREEGDGVGYASLLGEGGRGLFQSGGHAGLYPPGFSENDFKRQLLMLFMYSKTGR